MRRSLLVLITCLVLTAPAFAATAPAFAVTAPARAAWVWPVSGDVLTSYRNGTDPYATGQHRGIDIAAAVGTPVVAATGGEVRFAGTAGSSGLTVSIRTADGYDSSYLHLSSLAVRAGAHVSAGDRIGAVGMSGTRSTAAPHLHFGVRDAGTRHDYHDPLAFLPPPPAAPREPNPPVPAAAPAPQPAPPPAAPAPVRRTQPAPRPTPRLAPRQAPRLAPRAGRRPAPHATPRLAPHAGRRPAPHPAGGPAPRRTPRRAPHQTAAPVSHPAPRRTTHRTPEPATHSSSIRRPAPTPGEAEHASGARGAVDRASRAAPPAERSTAAARDSGESGPDIGWVLACGGLLLAAAVLGLSDDTRRDRAPRLSRLARGVLLPGRR